MKETKRSCGILIPDQFRKGILEYMEIDESEFDNKLNLGCGQDYIEGYTNLDGNPEVKADAYAELDDGNVKLDFKDCTFDFIYASHILEHIQHLPQLKVELCRILKPNGVLLVISPHYLSIDAWGDDTHCRAFSYNSFSADFWPGFEKGGKYSEFKIPESKDTPFEKTWVLVKLNKLGGEN